MSLTEGESFFILLNWLRREWKLFFCGMLVGKWVWSYFCAMLILTWAWSLIINITYLQIKFTVNQLLVGADFLSWVALDVFYFSVFIFASLSWQDWECSSFGKSGYSPGTGRYFFPCWANVPAGASFYFYFPVAVIHLKRVAPQLAKPVSLIHSMLVGASHRLLTISSNKA